MIEGRSQLEEIRQRHPADEPDHACVVCDGEYGCAERLGPYHAPGDPVSAALCDTVIVLAHLEKAEKVVEAAKRVNKILMGTRWLMPTSVIYAKWTAAQDGLTESLAEYEKEGSDG